MSVFGFAMSLWNFVSWAMWNWLLNRLPTFCFEWNSFILNSEILMTLVFMFGNLFLAAWFLRHFWVKLMEEKLRDFKQAWVRR